MGVSLTFSEPCAWPCASWTLSYLKTTLAWVLGKPYRISWNQMPSTCQSIPIRVLWKEDDSDSERWQPSLYVLEAEPGSARASAHTCVSREPGRQSACWVHSFSGEAPLFNSTAWWLAMEKQYAGCQEHRGGYPGSQKLWKRCFFFFIHFLPFQQAYNKAALLKQKSLNAWKTRLA